MAKRATRQETETPMETQAMTLPREKLLEWYHQMVLIRRFEERSLDIYHAPKPEDRHIGGVYLHVYNGQEATGVGALAALKPQDHVITAYRDHGIALARGVDPRYIMAEMFGKKTGVSGGKGGSMHIASAEHRMWGGYAIVGAFGPQGPTQCSGLPVVRYSSDELHDEFGSCFLLLDHSTTLHTTPWGSTQQFVYCYCRREH